MVSKYPESHCHQWSTLHGQASPFQVDSHCLNKRFNSLEVLVGAINKASRRLFRKLWKPPQNFVDNLQYRPTPPATVNSLPWRCWCWLHQWYLFILPPRHSSSSRGPGASLGALLCYYVIIYLAPPRTTPLSVLVIWLKQLCGENTECGDTGLASRRCGYLGFEDWIHSNILYSSSTYIWSLPLVHRPAMITRGTGSPAGAGGRAGEEKGRGVWTLLNFPAE